jgi:hypothetical protein
LQKARDPIFSRKEPIAFYKLVRQIVHLARIISDLTQFVALCPRPSIWRRLLKGSQGPSKFGEYFRVVPLFGCSPERITHTRSCEGTKNVIV